MVIWAAVRRWLALAPRQILVFLLIGGAVVRIAYLIFQSNHFYDVGEAHNVAMTFASTGVLGDPFVAPSGPTAHLTPVMPIIAGSVFWLFGGDTFAAAWLLSLIAIGFVLGSIAFLYLAAKEAGTPRAWRLLAAGYLCLFPVFIRTETIEFRTWEGGLTAFLSAILLWMLVRADHRNETGVRLIVIVSLLAGLLFLVNPPAALAGYAGCAVLAFRKLPMTRWPGAAMIGMAGLALVLTPWVVRNYLAFGQFIPVRSNFGLEFALANHPAAVPGTDQAEVLKQRLYDIHPNDRGPGFANMRAAGGEAQYAKAIGAVAMKWAREHPADFARLCARHLRQYFFPPLWLFNPYSGDMAVSRATIGRAVTVWVLTMLGLIGAILAVFKWRDRFVYLALAAVIPAMPYMITQPILRYRYLIYAPLIFIAVELCRRMAASFSRELPTTPRVP